MLVIIIVKDFYSYINSSSDKLFEAFRSLLKINNIDSSSSTIQHYTINNRLLLLDLIATIIKMLINLNNIKNLAIKLYNSSKSYLYRVIYYYKLAI